VLSVNPARKLKKNARPTGRNQTEPRRLTAQELDDLIACSLPTYRPIIETAAKTGMRASELLGLTWADISFEDNEIRVRMQLTRATKAADRAGLNGKGRTKLSMHDLRHTYCSMLVASEVPINKVSRIMGHSRPSFTLDVYGRYAPTTGTDEGDVIERAMAVGS
jgi:integrase